MTATVIVPGNIGSDAEMGDANGTPICKFSVASNQKIKGENKTTWFSCVMWGQRGQSLCQYLRSGTKVTVIGQLDINIWTPNDGGETRVTPNITVQEITLQGAPQQQAPAQQNQYQQQSPQQYNQQQPAQQNGNNNQHYQQNPPHQQQPAQNNQYPPGGFGNIDDDIPF